MKFILTFINLIIVLTIYSCRNTDNRTSNSVDTVTSKSTEKEPNSSIKIGGTYSFGEDVEKGPVGLVTVYPLTDNTALFYLDVCRGAPSYNLGQLFGQMTIKDNIGTYRSVIKSDDISCSLKFKFSARNVEVITESGHGDCGFGGNVYADNEYKLIDKSIPKYFINGEGDTILFKGLTVEKYEHRF